MKPSLRSALAAAHAAFAPRPAVLVESVRLPVRAATRYGVRRRLAGETAVTIAPISITVPKEDTAEDVSKFCLAQFEPAARRLARAA